MRKAILFLSLLFLVVASFPQKVSAAFQACSGVQAGTNVALPFWRENPPNNYTHTVVVDMSSYDKSQEWQICATHHESALSSTGDTCTPKFRIDQDLPPKTDGNGTLTIQSAKVTWVISNKNAFVSNTGSGGAPYLSKRWLSILQNPNILTNNFCTIGYYTTTRKDIGDDCKMYISQQRDGNSCYSTGCMESGVATTVRIEGLRWNDVSQQGFTENVKVAWSGGSITEKPTTRNGILEISFLPEAGTQNITVYSDKTFNDWKVENCYTAFSATNECGDLCEETRTDVAGQGVGITGNFRLCEQAGNNVDRQKCLDCVGGTTLDGQTGMWTAIGCIPTNAQGIITTIVQLGLGMGGGITLLLILAGAFRLSVAQGDPKQAEEAKEQITSAVIGLLFIIFSITMLRFIGVQVLHIPGFGT